MFIGVLNEPNSWWSASPMISYTYNLYVLQVQVGWSVAGPGDTHGFIPQVLEGPTSTGNIELEKCATPTTNPG